MWQSYFFELQKKYNMRVSTKEPLVIRFDGKNVTKDKSINIFHDFKGSFRDAVIQTITYFTQKYHCYAIFGSDEISFVFDQPMLLIEDLDVEKTNFSNEIMTLFSQYFFDYFNTIYANQKIFWHGKCFSIPKGKLLSYLKYRSKIIQNVMSTYYLKMNQIKPGSMNLLERLKRCATFNDFDVSSDTIHGTLYFDGEKFDLNDFLNGITTKKVSSQEQQKQNDHLANEDYFSIEFIDF